MIKVVINNQEFYHFASYEIKLQFNSIADTFKFSGLQKMMPFILDYSTCEIYNESNDLLLSGVIVSTAYLSSAQPELLTYSGYSKAGILQDCTIGIKQYPLQVDNLSLNQICSRFLKDFNIGFTFTNNVAKEFNKRFAEITSSPAQNISSFITNLSNQRGIVLSHDNKGDLLFTSIDIDKLQPLYKFTDTSGGYTSMSFVVDGQQLHSEITVFKQASESNPDGGQRTVSNPYVKGIYRPTVKTLSEGDIFDIEKMARMELSKELSSMKLMIELPFYIAPGNLIEVNNSQLNINNDTLFFIEETTINGTANSEKYSLVCSLTDVYTLEKEVKNIFENDSSLEG